MLSWKTKQKFMASINFSYHIKQKPSNYSNIKFFSLDWKKNCKHIMQCTLWCKKTLTMMFLYCFSNLTMGWCMKHCTAKLNAQKYHPPNKNTNNNNKTMIKIIIIIMPILATISIVKKNVSLNRCMVYE